jgi:hypothetical protein
LLLLDGGGLPIGIERGQHGAATIGQGANAPKLYPGNLAGSLLECLPQSLPESLSQSLTRTLVQSHDPAQADAPTSCIAQDGGSYPSSTAPPILHAASVSALHGTSKCKHPESLT